MPCTRKEYKNETCTEEIVIRLGTNGKELTVECFMHPPNRSFTRNISFCELLHTLQNAKPWKCHSITVAHNKISCHGNNDGDEAVSPSTSSHIIVAIKHQSEKLIIQKLIIFLWCDLFFILKGRKDLCHSAYQVVYRTYQARTQLAPKNHSPNRHL